MTQLTGRILQPGDPGWDIARRGFALWPDYDANPPLKVVFCQNAHDVIHAVKWSRENQIPLRARSGRHNYEGYSSLVKGGIIIDVSEMDTVEVSADRKTATVGAGIDMLDLYERLDQVGVTIPGATGPSVGLAGLALGGGFGPTSRKFGLTCDNVLEVELVNAHGELVRASDSENADLFWALRGGGGGNFGIVTRFTLKVHPVSNVVIYTINWSWDRFTQVVKAWQPWAQQIPDSLTSSMMLYGIWPQNPMPRPINMYGMYTADDSELGQIGDLLAPMLADTGPIVVNIQALPYIDAVRVMLGVDPTNPQWRVDKHGDDEIFKSTSSFAFSLFDDTAIGLLKSNLEALPALSAPPTEPSMIQLLGAGGAPGSVADDATAIWYRKAKFIVQYNAYWTAPEDGAKNIAWITGFRRTMLPYTQGAYVNYVDDTLDDPLRAYYGPHLERLVEVKLRYDPENFFQFPQSIPVSLPK
ncbi:MAG TPA: FAD-binding oxidoreductase [Chthonomonadaceae bacterium]|nr:FAD-binding oxidoreductase [Chthonomonadaceae bacterium]